MTSPVLPSEFLVKSLDDAIEIIREKRLVVRSGQRIGQWLWGEWAALTLENIEVYLDKQASRILMEAGQ